MPTLYILNNKLKYSSCRKFNLTVTKYLPSKEYINSPRKSLVIDRRHRIPPKEYNYIKGPNDPTYISEQRAQYIYNLSKGDINSLRKVKLRTAHDSSSDQDMICFLEKDVINLKKKLGTTNSSEHLYTVESSTETCKYPKEKPQVYEKYGNVLGVAIISNCLILAAKGVSWYWTGSSSMLAEVVHSFIDVTNQIILAVGVQLASKQPTAEHPYGWTKARHIFALISSVSIFSMGTAVSVAEGFTALYRDSELKSLHWAFSILGISFILESWSLRVAMNSIIKNFHTFSSKSIFSKHFLEYLYKKGDPINIAVFMEDLVGLLGVSIAFISLLACIYFKSSVPDSIGSIAIGCLLAFAAILMAIRNVNFLLETSIDLIKRESIIDFIESDKLVRSVHDVKATFMDNNNVKFKAEINFDGTELAKAYLYDRKSRSLLYKVKKIKTQRQLNNFIVKQGNGLLNQLGQETDRLERKIKKKYPELRHIDLETL